MRGLSERQEDRDLGALFDRLTGAHALPEDAVAEEPGRLDLQTQRLQLGSVVGLNEADAIAELRSVGLQAESTRFFGDRVFRQSVSPGETVEQGTKVTILLTFG